MFGVVAAGSVLEDPLEQASILQSTRSIDLQKSIGQDVATATTTSTTPMDAASLSKLDLVELTKGEEEQFLAEHNYYRCMHGAPALKWHPGMAASAATWGKSCCGSGLKHSKSYSETPSSGENLAAGSATIRGAVEQWYEEVSDCKHFPGCEKGEEGKVVGHFTAMVWKSTKLLGCARNAKGWKGYPLYICRYAEDAPNMGGRYEANVFKASVSSKDCGRDPAPGPATGPATGPAPSPALGPAPGPAPGPEVNKAKVSCGNHEAATCGGCPHEHGSAWCNGECHWTQTQTCEPQPDM